MTTSRNPVLVAIVGLTLIAVVIALAINYGRLPLVSGGDTYRAEFTDASGLQEGEEVRVAGIKVGTVTDIELGKARVVVTFEVDGVTLGKDTTAGIEVKTLLGQHYLSLTPAGEGELEAGATIPLSRTATPVNIVPAFQRLTTQAQRIDTEQVADAFDALAGTLNRTAPEMKGTLRGLARLSRTVSSRDEDIRRLFEQASHVSGVVAARDEELGQLLADTGTVLDALDRRRDTIAAVIDRTAALSVQLTGLVRDNRDDLAPTLKALNRVLDVLVANRSELDEIIEGALLYGTEFANVGGSGRWFDATIKLPRGQALCSTPDISPTLATLLNPVLSDLNQAVNGSNQPCLPLGPAGGELP